MPTNQLPIQEKPVVSMTEAERLAQEDIKRLELEQQERQGAKLGQAGKQIFGTPPGPPPKSSTQQPIQQAQTSSQALSQLFAQMTSVGYKPSSQALGNSGNQAASGSLSLSRTWLAALFIRLLKRKHFVE